MSSTGSTVTWVTTTRPRVQNPAPNATQHVVTATTLTRHDSDTLSQAHGPTIPIFYGLREVDM